jgi:PAS domain S-box-containing protein
MPDTPHLTPYQLGEIFPQVEKLLHFGVYVYDLQTQIQHWSDGVFSILGIAPGSIPASQTSFLKYVHRSDIELVASAMRHAVESHTTYEIEFSITDEAGNFKRIYAENQMIRDESGKVLQYNGLLKDITEKYLNNRMLEQKIQQLDKSNNNLQEFVYVASHDLQEPLRKITTFTDRLQYKCGPTLTQEANMYISRINAAGRNMQLLLEDLLDFSRLSFTDKQYVPVSIEDTINDVLSDLEITIAESRAKVLCDNLPEVEGYPSQLRQLFNNLINNSIKFKKPDTTVEISIVCDDVNHEEFSHLPLKKELKYMRIVIQDNGIGFDQEFSERIFMVFQRLHGKVEFSGSGIGLAICKKIVDNHHGFIYANGVLNEGATFTVLLPQTQA